jgi:uncharacterized integral membrane protein/Tfp pilus assembly protein PilE
VGTVIIVLVAIAVIAIAATALLFARRQRRVREDNRTQARSNLQQAQQLTQRADTEQAAGQMQLELAQRERDLAEQRATHLEHQAQDKIHRAETERAEASALHQHAHGLAPDLNDATWQPPTHPAVDAATRNQPTWAPPQKAPTGHAAGSPGPNQPNQPPRPPAAAAWQPPLTAPQPAQPVPQQPPPATTPADRPLPGVDHRGRVRRTRAGGIWVGLIASAIVLLVLLIFILQNSQTVVIHFLGFRAHLAFAVVMLIAAVCGLLLLATPGTVRIMQLGRALKKTADPGAAAASNPPSPDQPHN